ncbi:hypothetical protein ZIOFF_050986 [Zingiber officinale]|uniref:Polyamine transporter PUT1 n=1 Tax=Zingiber officinale TaxID=94328 RepID=A0A8J5FRV2_ZINOF|nr:hypothetical protein ZIOFF_050986 [Zingiber officinale]
MFQGVHDPNEEKVVKSLRDTLLSKGQLPEKYDDYHTLLRVGVILGKGMEITHMIMCLKTSSKHIQFPYKMYVWIHGVDVRTSKICELGILNYRAKRVLWIALRQLEICVTMLKVTRSPTLADDGGSTNSTWKQNEFISPKAIACDLMPLMVAGFKLQRTQTFRFCTSDLENIGNSHPNGRKFEKGSKINLHFLKRNIFHEATNNCMSSLETEISVSADFVFVLPEGLLCCFLEFPTAGIIFFPFIFGALLTYFDSQKSRMLEKVDMEESAKQFKSAEHKSAEHKGAEHKSAEFKQCRFLKKNVTILCQIGKGIVALTNGTKTRMCRNGSAVAVQNGIKAFGSLKILKLNYQSGLGTAELKIFKFQNCCMVCDFWSLCNICTMVLEMLVQVLKYRFLKLKCSDFRGGYWIYGYCRADSKLAELCTRSNPDIVSELIQTNQKWRCRIPIYFMLLLNHVRTFSELNQIIPTARYLLTIPAIVIGTSSCFDFLDVEFLNLEIQKSELDPLVSLCEACATTKTRRAALFALRKQRRQPDRHRRILPPRSLSMSQYLPSPPSPPPLPDQKRRGDCASSPANGHDPPSKSEDPSDSDCRSGGQPTEQLEQPRPMGEVGGGDGVPYQGLGDRRRPEKRHKLSILPLVFLIFYEVSGGPFGVEDSVGAGGPLLALLGFLLFPLIWSVPEALITAELGTMFPENGGYVVWVSSALGPFCGFQQGWMKWLSGVIDNALYPILFLDYLKSAIPRLAAGPPRGLAALALTVLLTYMNYRGLTVVGGMAVFLGAFSVLPFLVMGVVAVPKLKPKRWVGVDFHNVDWNLYLNTLFWNLNYWDSISTLAGEVSNPAKTLPRSLFYAVILVVSAYLFPLFVGTGALPVDRDEWADGYFSDVALAVGGLWLSWWVRAAAAVSNMGMFVAEMSSDSYQLLGMAERGMLPEAFARRSRHGTPLLGILFSASGVVLLSWLSFQEIVAAENFLYCFGMLMEFAAFWAERRRWLKFSVNPELADFCTVAGETTNATDHPPIRDLEVNSARNL